MPGVFVSADLAQIERAARLEIPVQDVHRGIRRAENAAHRHDQVHGRLRAAGSRLRSEAIAVTTRVSSRVVAVAPLGITGAVASSA
jgi:hypothetical protein